MHGLVTFLENHFRTQKILLVPKPHIVFLRVIIRFFNQKQEFSSAITTLCIVSTVFNHNFPQSGVNKTCDSNAFKDLKQAQKLPFKI